MDYKKIAEDIISGTADLKAIAAGEKKLTAVELLPLAVKVVEAQVDVKAMSSDDKKALALAIVAQLAKIDDGEASLLGKLVDGIVHALNSIFGTHWLEKSSS